MSTTKEIIQTLKRVLPKEKEVFPLHEPLFEGNEWAYVKECIDIAWVSSVGKYVDLFEEKLAEFTGVKRAVAVVNGTAALHVCLRLAGVKENDEVLIPSLTFIATANAVTYCHAIPHFIDVEERTLGVDPRKLEAYLHEIADIKNGECWNKETGRRIKAVVPMHTFGHPVDVDPLLELCEKYGITLVEDAAESLGSYYKGTHTGNFGLLSAMSFNGNKIITTGGGGAILTNDEELGKLAKHLTTTAKVPHRWAFEHDAIGYNYRMPNINAALGVAQLESLPNYLERKRLLAETYEQLFKGMDDVQFFKEQEWAKSNYWLNTLLIQNHPLEEVLEAANDEKIFCRPIWNPMHTLDMYQRCPKMDLSTTETVAKQVMNIPSSVRLGDEG